MNLLASDRVLKVLRNSSAVAVMSALLFASVPFAALAQTSFISFDVFSGPPGTSINALGTNFAVGESVSVGFGGATTTTVSNAGGDFTLPLTVPSVPVGPIQITAIGSTSGLIATNSFFVEDVSTTSASTTSTASTTPSGPSLVITGGPTNGSVTNQRSVMFTFTTDADATTVCTFGTSFACGSPVLLGSTTSSTTLPLGDGPYTFSITATNASSTASTTQSVSFTVDTVAPVIAEVTSVTTPNNGTSVQYVFTSTKAGSVNLAGGCTTTGTASVGTSTITFGTLASGVYNCTLSVTDAAGNVSNTLTLASFTVNAPAPAPAPVQNSGGGGGGGYVVSGPYAIGYVNNSQNRVSTAQPGGVVLGTSTVSYIFVRPLNIGSRGADVTALQIFLKAGGFLIIDIPTAYFGKLTFAAVKAYQKAHGLSQVGNVGPLTRALLNKGQ